MKHVLYNAVPYIKEDVTLALESGAHGLIVPGERRESAASLARCRVLEENELTRITLRSRADEAEAASLLTAGRNVLLCRGWEIIPVENLLAYKGNADEFGLLALEAFTPEEAALAAGILEKGVDCVVVPKEGLAVIKAIVAAVASPGAALDLDEAEITEISPVGLGHRVCVDTLSVLKSGQGMLTGNSAAFTFLVNAETEANEYVASRPFRVNAGAVHAYAVMPGDATSYLEELKAGSQVLIVDHRGGTETAVVGRVKVERRPMLLIRARSGEREGAAFLQNAETIRLVRPGGEPVSVVALEPGDRVLCRLDTAGRHFGMRIDEDITEE